MSYGMEPMTTQAENPAKYTDDGYRILQQRNECTQERYRSLQSMLAVRISDCNPGIPNPCIGGVPIPGLRNCKIS